MTTLYPLKFDPIFKYRLWGGDKIKKLLSKNTLQNQIGESWEISDVNGDETKVSSGALKGLTLKKLIQIYKEDFVGKKVYHAFGDTFPLLIKFIDAQLPLSIQVHTWDNIAKQRHGSFGKNEMWYIMDTDPGAELIVGFKKETTPQEYEQLLKDGKILDILHVEAIKSGDVFYIPTGRVHAIGAGVLLAEIQQSSDITYRIFDYNRIDASTGKERELHNDLASDVIDYTAHSTYKSSYHQKENEINTLVHSPYFKTNFLKISETLTRDYSSIDSFIIYLCVGGFVELKWENHQYTLQKGETILLPAVINSIVIISTQEKASEIIEIYI